MGDIFRGLIEIGVFLAFGLPVLIGGIMFLLSCFEEGMIFTWKGRMNRLSFVVNWIIAAIGAVIGLVLLDMQGDVVTGIGITVTAAALLRILSLEARRFHDFGINGVAVLIHSILSFVLKGYEFGNIAGLFFTLVLCLYPGNKNSNAYGDVPEKKLSFF